eukprot:Lankesteria_metandrocarpae@DN4989_c2_g1_i1.p1
MNIILVTFSVWFGMGFQHGGCPGPTPATELPVDTSYSCMFRVYGAEEYTLLPTTKMHNGRTVYQGVNNDTCEPINRYLFNLQPRHWYIGEVLYSETSRIPDYNLMEICDLWKSYPATAFGNGKLLGPIASSRCVRIYPKPAAKLPVDTSHPASFSVSGYEEYTLIPTTTKIYGQTVYQGIDKETCQPLNRYLFKNCISGDWVIDVEARDYRIKTLEGNGYLPLEFNKFVPLRFQGVGYMPPLVIDDWDWSFNYHPSYAVRFKQTDGSYRPSGLITLATPSRCFQPADTPATAPTTDTATALTTDTPATTPTPTTAAQKRFILQISETEK